MTSPFSFFAYVDESGDEGFSFANGSSEWFVLSALVFRSEHHQSVTDHLARSIQRIERERNSHIHFKKLKHEQRIPIIHALSKARVRACSICVQKTQLDRENTLQRDRRLYFYTTRLLAERLSWLCRDNQTGDPNQNGRVKITFAHCKNLSYSNMRGYLRYLRDTPGVNDQVRVAWEHLNPDEIEVIQCHQRVGLKFADMVASGIRYGLDVSKYGFAEDRYASMIKPVVYNRRGNYSSYGMKFMPASPEVEPDRDGRYAWLALYQ